MANFKHNSFLNLLFGAGMAFTSTAMGFSLIDSGTDAPVATDTVRSDISAGAIVAKTAVLSSKTVGSVSVGAIDAADATASAVSGATIEGIWLLDDSGTPASDNAYAYWDTGVTGLPATPNGGDITVQINAAGIIVAS